MSPADARAAIETAIEAAWTSTPIAWPNRTFIPPEPPTQWLKVDFIWGNGQLWTKDGVNTIAGILQLSIFGKKDVGDGALDTSAEIARAIFNRTQMAVPNETVIFGPASGPVKLSEDAWRSAIVSVPFQVLETV